MPKPRSQTAAARQHEDPALAHAKAERLADQLADRAYGEAKEDPDLDKPGNVSISLPLSLTRKLQEVALVNKHRGSGPKTVSAIIREALAEKGY